jgi:two-component system nitrogen regulation sensor histidine kinase NtrY
MRFIQNYRQLSRIPPPKKKKIPVADYFQHLEALVSKELSRKNINLSFHHKPASMSVTADEDMLDQVLINLIRNATDTLAESDGGKVSVSGYLDDKQRTVLEVRDNGEGVPEELAEKIFMPFFTTRKHGSGIGLALVRHIMLSHGGAVIYTPGDDSGSIFRLIF